MGQAQRARHFSRVVVEHNKLACQMLAGLSAQEAIRMVSAAVIGLASDGTEPVSQILRRQVQVQLALREELAV